MGKLRLQGRGQVGEGGGGGLWLGDLRYKMQQNIGADAAERGGVLKAAVSDAPLGCQRKFLLLFSHQSGCNSADVL